jgi:hypothetical protein
MDYALTNPTIGAGVDSLSYFAGMRADYSGSVSAYVLYNGAGPAVSAPVIPPTQFVRVRCSVAQAQVTSFGVIFAQDWP